MGLSAHDVDAAHDRLVDVVRHTPTERSERLSHQVGVNVWLKREDLQIGRSYKVRGAYNVMSTLPETDRSHGVVCASAGNHAQGVAYACRALSIKGTVVLPTTSPRQKRDRIIDIGGQWIDLELSGSTFDQASDRARTIAQETGAFYVQAFNDPRTIAGQGTVAVELFEGGPTDLGAVIVPVGGGGLAAGIALWLKANHPDIAVIGVEPAGAASMTAALAAGHPINLSPIDTFVDGAAVGHVGEETFPIVRDLVDEMLIISEGAVCTEMLELYQVDGVIAEPAGALASAAALEIGSRFGPLCCIVSGGNNDVSRYADILERSLIHRGVKHYFLVMFPQEPRALRHFLESILGPDDDITLFEYVKKSSRESGPALIGIELTHPEDLPGLLERMDDSPLQVERVLPGSPAFGFLV